MLRSTECRAPHAGFGHRTPSVSWQAWAADDDEPAPAPCPGGPVEEGVARTDASITASYRRTSFADNAAAGTASRVPVALAPFPSAVEQPPAAPKSVSAARAVDVNETTHCSSIQPEGYAPHVTPLSLQTGHAILGTDDMLRATAPEVPAARTSGTSDKCCSAKRTNSQAHSRPHTT